MYTLLIQVLDTTFIKLSSDNLKTTVLSASFSTLKLIWGNLKINKLMQLMVFVCTVLNQTVSLKLIQCIIQNYTKI